MGQIKLVAIDLDGTFLTDEKSITEENKRALQAAIAHGIKIVICTGRTLPGVRRFLQQLPFFEEGDYIILQNGAATHALPGLEIVAQQTVSTTSRAQAWDILQAFRNQGVQLVAFNQDDMFLVDETQPSEIVQKDAETLDTAIKPVSCEQFLAGEDLNKMMVLGSPEVLDKLEQAIPTEFHQLVNVVRSQAIIVEFLPKGVNKRSALESLVNQLGLEAHNVMAIGDQLNDIEMLEYAGLSVAMANAVPKVRTVADVVTKSNNESGVAHIIQQKVLTI
ncbi:Cof-type HAD-IIB family hydrolase [Aerococcaceae bacterium NML190073]|nr:Cof-type HAD-IIB family hydrolase [Aerococcaceae bacterium NML190073]